MSSSNLVRIAFIEESTYGVTPAAGNFETARFTSETLSGSPDTVESKQLRSDRMSSGQIVTGLQVQGAMNFELAKESQLELFMASAMYSSWTTKTLVTVDLSYNSATGELTRASGSWITDGIVKGDFLTFTGFTNAVNNTQAIVVSVDSATVIKIAAPGLVTEAGTGTTFKRADKIGIGTTKKSFSLEKKFTDLTDKAIIYKGAIVSSMDLNVAYGDIINGVFGLMANGHVIADTAGEHITNARTINAPATTSSLNGSIDMPFFASDVLTGTLEISGFPVKSVGLKLDNGLNAQTVIGTAAPIDYTPGTAKVDVSMEAYLNDATFGILPKKLTQDPFAIGFMVKNAGGAYGFFLPQVQVTFDDPATGGQNQDIMTSMSGMAKVGATGESALTVYRF